MRIKQEHLGMRCKVRGLSLIVSGNMPMYPEHPFTIASTNKKKGVDYVTLVISDYPVHVWEIRQTLITIVK